MEKTKWSPEQDQLERVQDELLSKHQDEEIHYTTCPQNGCFEMCVLRTHVKDGKVTAIETDDSVHEGMGREDEYCNPDDLQKGMYQRRACPRGRGMREDAYSPNRILYPMKRVGPKGTRQFERISWDEALDTIARKYLETREKYGPFSVHCDGMLGVSWDYFGQHLPGGAIGMWGEDSYEPTNFADQFTYGDSVTIPSYFAGKVDGNSENQTFLDSKLIILWGFDACINYPETVYYLLLAKEKGIPIITLDPRYTWTAETLGTQHIFIRPGTDLAMFAAMCQVIFEEDLYDHEFCDKWVEPNGLNQWWAYVMGQAYNEAPKTPEWAAPICGVPAETIRELARLYATTSQTGPVYIRMVWAAARQIYGKQTARGFNYLQALCGNLGKKGCAGNGVGFGVSGHIMAPNLAPFMGDAQPEYGATICMEAEMWHRAINLRPQLEAGEITEEFYKAEIGCPQGFEAPNIHMMLSIPSNRNHAGGWYGTNERIEAMKKLDFFAYAHWNFASPTVPYADIVLPYAQQYLEGPMSMLGGDPLKGFIVAINGGCQNVVMYADGGAKPAGEARHVLWILHELAERMGLGDKVLSRLRGVAPDDVSRVVGEAAGEAWESWRQTPPPFGGAAYNPPPWEEFSKKPVFMVPMDDYHVFMRRQYENDEPLSTDSGKIEFYSDWIANADLKVAIHAGGKCFGNGTLPPIARYKHSPEGPHSAKTKKFPLYMVTPHSLFRHHTAYDHNRWFRDEFRNSVWMSIADAKVRGIKDGDQVMVENEVGQCIVPAYVTSRMSPGTCAILFGRWYEPSAVKTDIMPEGIDTRGNCNFLVPSDFHDDVLGAALDGALVEIQSLDAKLNLERLQEVK